MADSRRNQSHRILSDSCVGRLAALSIWHWGDSVLLLTQGGLVTSVKTVRFGHYDLVERLAVGGMAEVFLGIAPENVCPARLVALKRVLPSVGENQDFVNMFLDEAKITNRLVHKNIGRIYEVGKTQETYFIAMEYISGHDLRVLWERDIDVSDEPFPMDLAVYITKRICDALDYAHRSVDAAGQFQKLIHRDVSPQNVLISYRGEVKVIDFGIAKAANRSVRTRTGILKGKFAYMSPEQAFGGEIDHRTDIYAIGVMLYELLAGIRAFQGNSDFELIEKVRKGKITPLGKLRPDLPKPLVDVVHKAMARDIEERYEWASDFAEALVVLEDQLGLKGNRVKLGTFLRKHFGQEVKEEAGRLKRYKDAFRLDATQLFAPPELTQMTSLEGMSPSSQGANNDVNKDFDEEMDDRTLVQTPSEVQRELERLRAAKAKGSADTRQGKSRISMDSANKEGLQNDPQSTIIQARSSSAQPLPSSGPPTPPNPTEHEHHPNTNAAIKGSLGGSGGRNLKQDRTEDSHRKKSRPSSSSRLLSLFALAGGLTLGAFGYKSYLSTQPTLHWVSTPGQVAKVIIDGEERCEVTPCKVENLKAGQTVALVRGDLPQVSFKVEDPVRELYAKALPAYHSELTLVTEPIGAKVEIDGLEVSGTTPLKLPSVEVGSVHTIVIERTGYRTIERQWIVPPSTLREQGFELIEDAHVDTEWELEIKPGDAVVLDDTGEPVFEQVGRKRIQKKILIQQGDAASFQVERPGCKGRLIALQSSSIPKQREEIALECGSFDSAIKVRSKEPIRVEVDGVVLAKEKKAYTYWLPAGPHAVKLVGSAGAMYKEIVTEAKKTKKLKFELED